MSRKQVVKSCNSSFSLQECLCLDFRSLDKELCKFSVKISCDVSETSRAVGKYQGRLSSEWEESSS